MSSMWLLMALKEKERREKSSSKTKTEHNNTTKVVDNGPATYSFEEYVNYVAINSPEVSKFLEVICKNGTQIDKEDEEKVLAEFQELCEEYLRNEQVVADKQKELEAIGIKIGDRFKSEEHFYAIEVPEGRGFGGQGKFSYNDGKKYNIEFNGIKIDKDILSSETNVYEADYNAWEKENAGISDRAVELESEISQKEKKLKTTLFKREELKEEIEGLKQQLNRMKDVIAEGDNKRKAMETFANMTPEEKAKISEYLEAISVCEKNGKKILKKLDEKTDIGRGASEKERNKWERAFDRMVESGEISGEDIEKVNTILLEKHEQMQEEYEIGNNNYALNEISSGACNALWWYVDEKERFVDKAEPSLEDKEKCLKALEERKKELSRRRETEEQKKSRGEK